ncbi:MAG: metallophosphoesterase, partial [Gemmatimonadota bacterium]
MLSHAEILASLRQRFPVDPAFPERFGVALVAQYSEPALGLPAGRTHIFVPDCHLLTDQDAAVYRNNHFQQADGLETMLRGLRDLKIAHRGELIVWHLGDLFDVWRALGGRGDVAEIAAIAGRYATHLELLLSSPPDGVRARLLAGNHDYVTHELADWAALRVGIIENEDPAGGDILIVHGDVFDWVERALPDELQARVVQAAKLVSAGQSELNHEERDVVAEVNRHLAGGDTPIGISQARLSGIRPEIAPSPAAVNCVEAAGPGPSSLTTFYKDAAKV